MRPTSASALVVAGLAAAAARLAAAQHVLLRRCAAAALAADRGDLAALAVAECFLAQNTAARVERKPGAPRVDPLAVARYVGAGQGVVAGRGDLRRVLRRAARLARAGAHQAARDDVPAAVGGVIAVARAGRRRALAGALLPRAGPARPIPTTTTRRAVADAAESPSMQA